MRRAAFALAVLVSSAARADGAFPTGISVMLPAAAPQRILVGTTFGLVISEDAGATWRYVCESHVTGASNAASVLLYQAGQDGETVVASNLGALFGTADHGCTWTPATGSVSGLLIVDAFVDPSNPSSVLAIGWPAASGASLLSSSDAGRTFGPVLLQSGTPPVHADERLLSAEIAASNPAVLYATTFASPGSASPAGSAALLRSANGGASWARFELGLSPQVQAKIAQVDPADANTVYLRVSAATTDEIRVTSDGGATVQTLLAPGTSIDGFVRASDGALYAGSSAGNFYVRAPGATAFQTLPGPHLLCLGERAGRLYACGTPVVDGYDLAASDDGGKTFQKTLRFTEIVGPAGCVDAACANDFAQLQRTLAVVPASGNCSCGGSSGSGGVLLILLAAALRRRRRAPAPGRR